MTPGLGPLFAQPTRACPVAAAMALLIAQVQDQVGRTEKLARFLAFHAAHPEVYRAVERFALEAAQARARSERKSHRYGVRMVWERVRWEVHVAMTHDAEFKLNDHLHALYSRLFLLHHPEHADLFELRKLRREGHGQFQPSGAPLAEPWEARAPMPAPPRAFEMCA